MRASAQLTKFKNRHQRLQQHGSNTLTLPLWLQRKALKKEPASYSMSLVIYIVPGRSPAHTTSTRFSAFSLCSTMLQKLVESVVGLRLELSRSRLWSSHDAVVSWCRLTSSLTLSSSMSASAAVVVHCAQRVAIVQNQKKAQQTKANTRAPVAEWQPLCHHD
jgi:hypothetical protein